MGFEVAAKHRAPHARNALLLFPGLRRHSLFRLPGWLELFEIGKLAVLERLTEKSGPVSRIIRKIHVGTSAIGKGPDKKRDLPKREPPELIRITTRRQEIQLPGAPID